MDAFFAYIKTLKVSKKDTFGDAVSYALNQERYLRVFLQDGDVPIDNNASERAIRGFCVGKKNWQMIDTINGAKTSAIIYSIVETAKTTNLDKVKTCICVAHDEEESTHHALQLVVDDNLQLIDEEITFYHNGRIAVGRKGSGKISELRQYVADRYPKIIDGNKFNLGKLRNNKLWRLDDPEVIEVIVNLISYALIRDEYREYAKQR